MKKRLFAFSKAFQQFFLISTSKLIIVIFQSVLMICVLLSTRPPYLPYPMDFIFPTTSSCPITRGSKDETECSRRGLCVRHIIIITMEQRLGICEAGLASGKRRNRHPFDLFRFPSHCLRRHNQSFTKNTIKGRRVTIIRT